MKKPMPSVFISIAIGLASCTSTLAIAQAQEAITLGENDGVYIDPTSFKIIPGKAKGDTSAQIKKLAPERLAAGAIIFRSGDKLYIADSAPAVYGQDMGDRHRVYGQDMGDRHRVYGQDMDDRHRVYGQDMGDRHRVYGQDMGDRHRVYGQDMDDRHRVYGIDRDEPQRVYVNDPEYVQYKLKKAFEENWTVDTTK